MARMEWFRLHGSKALAFLLTVFTAAQGADPQQIADLIGDQGQRWLTFLLSAGTLAHSVFVAPKAAAKEAAKS